MTDLTYECEKCGATNVKLWRESCTFQPDVKCALCLGVAGIVKDGRVFVDGQWTDQLKSLGGWWLPCVPDQDGRIYGYTSVPAELVEWWYGLPDY